MIPRALSVSAELTKPGSTEPLKLPGLVSALRPIKRGSSQLSEEAHLLRRFTYKNKNQHKGCGWWRKIVEVDRVVERVGTELQALLGEFGIEKDKDDMGIIGERAVITGLLRLPRSMLIVEKSIEVMLSSASILEQLIHSRAFLSFALVVVALIARLHTLATVLLEDLGKVSIVLVKLIHANSLLPQLEQSFRQLPRELKRFVRLHPSAADLSSAFPPSANSSMPPSAAPTPRTRSPAPVLEEYGAKVSREEMLKSRSNKQTATPPVDSPRPSPSPAVLENVEMPEAPQGEVIKPQTSRYSKEETRRPPELAEIMSRPSPSAVREIAPPQLPVAARRVKVDKDCKEKKRRAKEGEATTTGEEVKRKKKKRVKAQGEDEDEIDSIFG